LASGAVAPNDHCFGVSLSADGRFAAFWSGATNLVAGDINDSGDVFVRDRTAGTTVRLSVSSLGAEADAASYNSSLSSNGAFVVFDSYATNLAVGDVNTLQDVFLRDVQAGTLELASLGPADVLGNGASLRPCVS